MARLLTTILTAALMIAASASPSAAGGANSKPPTARRMRPDKPVRRANRIHQTRGAYYKETQHHVARYDSLVRPGGRLMYNGRQLVQQAYTVVRTEGSGLASHWLRDSRSNRFSMDMQPGGITVTARVTDGPAARPRTYRPGHTVKRDRRNPSRELHVFEFPATQVVELSWARTRALTRYRKGRPEAAGRLVASRERLIVRPDGTQRLTIVFDPSVEPARLPLD